MKVLPVSMVNLPAPALPDLWNANLFYPTRGTLVLSEHLLGPAAQLALKEQQFNREAALQHIEAARGLARVFDRPRGLHRNPAMTRMLHDRYVALDRNLACDLVTGREVDMADIADQNPASESCG